MNRRSFLQVTTSALAACAVPPRGQTRSTPSRPHPSPSQLAWQRDELALFLHFGVNTFTDREWGDGRENPSIFSPSALDARQWARAARNAGARALILTAKHHDGFCLWPTRTTSHSVAASPWRSGQGDVVREFVEASRAEGLKAGLYLSPWDRNNPAYGDSPKYNDLYCDQLTELLTRYGPVSEVWFDGANGEGPNGKRQIYDWPRFFGLVRQLQPNAVMFSDAGPDVRWCGNEKGTAGDPNWSTVNPDAVPFSRSRRSCYHRRVAAWRSQRDGLATSGSRCLDKARLVLSSRRGRPRSYGGQSRESLLLIGRPERKAVAQRSPDPGWSPSLHGCRPARWISRAAQFGVR